MHENFDKIVHNFFQKFFDGNYLYVASKPLEPLGHQQLTALSSATGLTAPNGAVVALLSVQGQDVRIRDDGTAPTSSVGVVLKANQQPWAYDGDLNSLQIIETAPSATVDILYYRYQTD